MRAGLKGVSSAMPPATVMLATRTAYGASSSPSKVAADRSAATLFVTGH